MTMTMTTTVMATAAEEDAMSKMTALSISVGICGLLSTWLTASLWHIPVWVVFLAWACFFFVGSGFAGALKSIACNWTGIVVATLTLLAVHSTASAFLLSLAVGIGSLAMVQLSRLPWVSFTPAIVFGFAMTVSTIYGRGYGITEHSWQNPALIAAAAAAVGAGFGVLSEWGAGVIGQIAARVLGTTGAEVEAAG